MLAERVRRGVEWHWPASDGADVQECARRVLVQVHRIACGIRGHDVVLAFEPRHLSLHCMNCGWKSPGWWISPRPASVARMRPTPARAVNGFERRSVKQTVDHGARRALPGRTPDGRRVA